ASGGEPPKPMTDGKDDKFATPGEAAKRLFEIRKLESETAAAARVDAMKNLAHDATIGRPSADIAADFKASMPAWVKEQKDLDLYKATLKQQGHLAEVAAIEKYEENFRFAEFHEQRAAEERQNNRKPPNRSPCHNRKLRRLWRPMCSSCGLPRPLEISFCKMRLRPLSRSIRTYNT